jgi:hypothetical protein
MSDGGIEDLLSERMHRFDKQMRPEIETTFITGWADEVAALEQRVEGLEEGVKHTKRWASGFNVHVNPQVVLDAVVRMCDDTLASQEEA